MSAMMYFYNYSDKPFTATWDKVPYTVPPKERMMLQDFLAKHIAKHFVDQMMMEDQKPTNHFSRKDYLEKCLFTGMEVEDAVKAEVVAMNENKKKPGRPKKVETTEETPQFE